MKAENKIGEVWINSLLTKLDLVKSNEGSVDLGQYWDQIEECHLTERIRKIVADVNEAAGYHVLELLDFLPPQRTVLRVSFFKKHLELVMEIVVDEGGTGLMFYSVAKSNEMWDRYFPNHSRKGNRVTFQEQDIYPAEVLEKDVQAWISYVLSGFNKKFKPSPRDQSSPGSELRISALLDKASA